MAPTLVFKSAALKNPAINKFENIKQVTADIFIDESVSLTNRQLVSVSALATKLANECIYDGASTKLKLEVRGFANDFSFRNEKKIKREDSDILNEAISNLRGQSVFKALSSFFIQNYPDLNEEVDIYWKPWVSLGEMRTTRDNYVFRNVQIALSPSIDHRSTVIIVSESGECPRFNSYLEDYKSEPLYESSE